MEYTTHSESETTELGKKIADELHGGDIVALHGELGSGKTTLVKGIAAGLGLTQEITSPTFTLMNVYTLNAKRSTLNALIHIDTYRLHNEKELRDIGVEDYLGDPETVCVVEWPEKITGLLQGKKVIDVILEHGNNQNERTIILSSRAKSVRGGRVERSGSRSLRPDFSTHLGARSK